MERIKLSEHFQYGKLLRFVLPSIIMMVFVSIYGIVDGFFVSNFVGEIEFASLNLIFPLIMILGSVGFMLGTGGNAVVSKALGEGNAEKANRIFSMLVYVTVIIGVFLSVTGIVIARPIAELFAQNEKTMSPENKAELIENCVLYARTILSVLPAFMLQNAFQGFFVTAEKPRLGLYVTVIAGCGNIFFDALFIVGFKWGLLGAGMATALNQLIGGIIPIIYFSRKNDSLLRLGKTSFDGKVLGKVCLNGLSELMTNISLSVIGIIYNAQLMALVGVDGVSAYGVLQYIGFIFVAVFLGYSVGSAPIIGYHFGAQNDFELKNVFKKSMTIVGVFGVVMTVIAIVLAKPLAGIFVGYDEELLEMTANGIRINALSFLTCGFNIFASAFFTALGSGGLSLFVSFSRTFFVQAVCVLLLPIWWGLNGVWSALVVAESITLILSIFLLVISRKKYHYA
ncbi:MAG: MATE family efflux transporter [Clostridiales bacterium]|nr:MATE family efflux transporter [Clostridiales bacterium]